MYLITPTYLVIIYTYNIVTGTVPLLYETLFPAWFSFYLLGMDCRSGNIGKWIKKINIYCYAICPKEAISMVEDEEGFEY